MAITTIQEEGFQGTPFTRKEAEAATQEFIRTGVELRHRMLELYERQAHKALGFTDFEEYATERLGLMWDNRYLNQLRLWARVERDVCLLLGYAQPSNTLSVEIEKKPLSRNVALELSKLPADTRRDAYHEAIALGATGKGELQCIKHIVTRRLNEANGVAPTIPPLPVPVPVDVPKPATVAARPAPVTDVAPASESRGLAREPFVVPPPVRSIAAPAPARPPRKEVEPAILEREDLPKTQWLEALYSTTTWLENDRIDADAPYRKEASTYLIQIARWVATGS